MLYVVLALCCLYLFWRLNSSRSQSLEPPDFPGKLPIIGHGHLFLGNSAGLFQLMKRLTQACLDDYGSRNVYLGLYKLYVVADPDDCLAVSNACLQKHFAYDFVRPLTMNGLLTADVPTWKKHRKLLNPAFNQQVLDGFIDVFNSQAQLLVDQFANEVGKPFSHDHIIKNNNLETICLNVTGTDTDEYCNIKKDYLPHLEGVLTILTQRFQKFWLFNDFIYNMTSLKKKQDEHINNLVTLSNSIIQKKKSEMKTMALNGRTQTTKNFKPFMELILELSKDIDSFTDDQIRGETDTIIAGGHDTCAYAFTFCLTLLGSNAQVQEKAYKEIIQVLGNSTNVDKESLSKLVYVEAVLKETLRLYPSAPIIGRHVDKDVKLAKYTLKANNGCMISIYGMNRHKIWGPDANTFRPERWFEKETLPDPKYYAAFAPGRRFCIGKAYAMMSLKILLARVLQSYRISSDVSKMVLRIDVLLRPDSGHDILLEHRKKLDN